jgi:hypothetical protein
MPPTYEIYQQPPPQYGTIDSKKSTSRQPAASVLAPTI